VQDDEMLRRLWILLPGEQGPTIVQLRILANGRSAERAGNQAGSEVRRCYAGWLLAAGHMKDSIR
jgi:hypothetical protein